MIRDRHVGTEPGRGWVVVDQGEERIRVAVGDRGVGHDEPARYKAASLTLAEAAELRSVLDGALAGYAGPVATTYNFKPRPCDACGEAIETQRESASYAGPPHGRLARLRARGGWVSYDWHIRCTPAWFNSYMR